MKVLKMIDWLIAGIFGGYHYHPIIPPHTRAEMEKFHISDVELLGAFHSKNIKTGHAPGATLGIAEYYGKVVGATYRRDTKDPSQWVIIGCFAYEKKASDWVTGRRHWNRWESPRPWEKTR